MRNFGHAGSNPNREESRNFPGSDGTANASTEWEDFQAGGDGEVVGCAFKKKKKKKQARKGKIFPIECIQIGMGNWLDVVVL